MKYDKDNIITIFSLLVVILITLRWANWYISFLFDSFYQELVLLFMTIIILIFIFNFLSKNKLHDYAKKHGLILRSYNKNQYVFSINKLNMPTNSTQPSDENLLQLSSRLLSSQLFFSLIIVPVNDDTELYLIVSRLVKSRSDIDNFVDQLSGIKAAFHAHLGFTITNEYEKAIKNELPIPF